MSETRRDWFPTQPRTLRLGAMEWIAASFFWWVLFWTFLVGTFPHWALFAVNLCALAPAVLLLGGRKLRRRSGIKLDDDALTFVSRFGRRRRVAWERISKLHHYGAWATFFADGELVELDQRTAEWQELYAEIERHVPPETASLEGPRVLPADEIARCLGIAARGELRCRPPGLVWLVSLAPPLAVALLAFLPVAWSAPLVACVALGALLAVRTRRSREVRADVHGLTARRGSERLRVPWSEVQRMEMHRPTKGLLDFELTVTTDEGAIRFPLLDAGGGELMVGISRLLASRDAGYDLPSRAPLSDAALSPARLGGETDPERGLSRVADDSPS
jgi:hypothetical protein